MHINVKYGIAKKKKKEKEKQHINVHHYATNSHLKLKDQET